MSATMLVSPEMQALSADDPMMVEGGTGKGKIDTDRLTKAAKFGSFVGGLVGGPAGAAGGAVIGAVIDSIFQKFGH